MLSARHRRRSGIALSGLLLFQGLFMAVGACAQEHGTSHDPVQSGADAHEVAGHAESPEQGAPMDCCLGHAAGATAPAPGPDLPAPVDCAALAGCSVPALGVEGHSDPPASVGRAVAAEHPPASRPDAVDLSITTPPPKGLPS
jgi:hypothetical protein